MSILIQGYVKSLTASSHLVLVTIQTEAGRCGTDLAVLVSQAEATNWIPGQAVTLTIAQSQKGAAR